MACLVPWEGIRIRLGVPTWCLEPGLARRNRLLVALLLGGLYGEASLGHALLKLLGLDLGV